MIYNFQLLDCTLREGMQAIHPHKPDRGVVFNREESLAIVQKLIDFKINFVEFGAPVQSKYSSELIATALNMTAGTNVRVNVHCRLHEDDLSATLPLSPHGYNFYFNLSRSADISVSEKVINKIIVFSERIKGVNPEATIRFSFENSFKTNYSVISQVTKAILPYVDRIGLPDTTGGAKPSLVHRRLTQFRRDFPEVPIELHFHNDFGLAAANMCEALHVKNTIIHTTILGIGERNGILSTSHAIAVGMMTNRSALRIQANYNCEKLVEMDQYVAQCLNMPVPPSLPITSTGFFSHLAGVHVHGQTLNRHRYQLLNPATFGRTLGTCWASAVVGKANISSRAHDLGVFMTAKEAQELAAQIREYAKRHGGVSSKYVDKKICQYPQRNEA